MLKLVKFSFALLILVKLINGDSSSSSESDEVIRNRNAVFPQPGVCGVEDVTTYDKETNVVIGENPWQAFFISESGTLFDCNGVLINARYVLTKGYCLRFVIIKYVRFGDWNMNTDPDCDEHDVCADNYVDYEIDEVILENKRIPRKSRTVKTDAGLIRLNRNVEYTKWIKPICLPFHGDLFTMDYDTASFIVGAYHNSNKTFTKAISTPITLGECARIWIGNVYETAALTTSQFCANLTNINVSDFNAPYAIQTSTLNTGIKYKYIVGIMSYRFVYNNIYFGDRTSYLYNFIRRNTYV